MSIVVEDGSGLANAESMVSVAYCDAYQANRGDTLWVTMTTSEKEAAIRRATDYIEQVYGHRWIGYRKLDTQALSWPRSWAFLRQPSGYHVYYDSIPSQVLNACADLAIRAAAGPLVPDREERVKKRTKVGEIEVEYEAGTAPRATFKTVDMTLAPLLRSSEGSMRIVRS